MDGPHPLYRSLVLLYPREFRREYGEDLVAHYADLVVDRGARAARTRTALDLAITIPRYHLEHVMTEQRSATTLSIVIGLFGIGGLAGLATDIFPGSFLFFVVAVVLAVAQRSTLARALRVPDSRVRRRRLRIAGILAVIFAVSYVAFDLLIGESWTIRETVITMIGVPAMFGAVGFLIAGLLTPRTPDASIAAGTS